MLDKGQQPKPKPKSPPSKHLSNNVISTNTAEKRKEDNNRTSSTRSEKYIEEDDDDFPLSEQTSEKSKILEKSLNFYSTRWPLKKSPK